MPYTLPGHDEIRHEPTPTPTPTSTPVVSQGVAAHGATAWQTADPTEYKGDGVRVGVIDMGFGHFNHSATAKELPPVTRVSQRCHTSTGLTRPSSSITNCVMVTDHGTAVVEALVDVAEDVSLYLSNAARLIGRETARKRLQEDVNWMIQEGVDVIVASVGWGLDQSLGDGVARYLEPGDSNTKPHPLETIKSATDAKILWVNSTGNDHGRHWRGPFNDVTVPADNIHDYTNLDDRNYVVLPAGNHRAVSVQMRWNDSWGSSNCDLDLYLHRERLGRTALASIGNNSQIGRTDDIPHEVATAWRVYPSSTTAEKYYVTIRKRVHGRTTTDPCADVDWVELTVRAIYGLEHTTTGSIIFPATSRDPGLLAVGAAPHYNTSTIQSYSSQGPTTDERVKPEVVGADCGEAMLRPSEFVPGTSTAKVGTNCWFWGTSQAAPHVAGLAALIIDRYDNPDARQYTATDLADWIKDAATPQDTTTDPNNTWGHGFAMLPDPAPTASLSPVPSSINVGTSTSPTLTATNVGTDVNVVINRAADPALGVTGDTGNLALDGICPGSDEVGVSATHSETVSIKGCVPGKATIRLYKKGTKILLASSPVDVVSTATIRPSRVGSTTAQTAAKGSRKTISVASRFTRAEWYTVASSDETVVAASMGNSDLKITGIEAGSARVTVTAHNGIGTATQTYHVTVTNPTSTNPPPNPPANPPPSNASPPTVNAGDDKTVNLGANVYISGTGSPVNDDDDMTFAWTQTDATTVSMLKSSLSGAYVPNSPGSDSFEFVAPLSSTTLVFRLTVTDLGTGLTASDTVTVTVG